MIKSVTITNDIGKQLILELARPDLTGLAVLDIDGIGPGKASVNVREHASMDGDTFNSARIPSRSITIQLRYYPTREFSVEAARKQSYRFFSPKKKIKMRFETDTRICDIEGYVESNEPQIFKEKSGGTVSIICPKPFFKSLEQQTTDFYYVTGSFEFPFSNESLTEPLISLGETVSTQKQLIKYQGDADTGVTITIMATNDTNHAIVNPYISNATMGEVFSLDSAKIEQLTGAPFHKGDTIVITTEKGNKTAYLIRENVAYSILGCIARGSTWLQLRSGGEQVFEYDAEEGANYMKVRIQNDILYEGV